MLTLSILFEAVSKTQGNGYQSLFCGLSSFLSLSHENLNVI